MRATRLASLLTALSALLLMAACAAPSRSYPSTYADDGYAVEESAAYDFEGEATGGSFGATAEPSPPPSPAPMDDSMDMVMAAESAPARSSRGERRRERRAARRAQPESAPPPPPAQQTPGPTTTAPDPEPEPADSAESGPRGPLLIYEAQIGLAVRELNERMAAVVEIADEVGGYLQRQDDSTVVIRVPAEHFRDALDQIEEVGDVINRRVSAEDVSEQFRDTTIRLRNAMVMRDRMEELLERASNVAESLAIQRELERLTQEIELYRGMLESLQDRIAFSTITVNFRQIQEESQVPRERFRLPFPFLNRLGLPALMAL